MSQGMRRVIPKVGGGGGEGEQWKPEVSWAQKKLPLNSTEKKHNDHKHICHYIYLFSPFGYLQNFISAYFLEA